MSAETAAEQSRYTDDTLSHPEEHTGMMVDLTLCLTVELFSDQSSDLTFLCQSLLDEALLSTLPPSNMAQSEPLYTQAAAAAAASTSLDHQDTADPLSALLDVHSHSYRDQYIHLMREEETTEVINQCLVRLSSSAVSQ